MKEFINKLIERLEEEHEKCINRYGVVGGNLPASEVKQCMEIVNQLAEEYKGGWIPVSERLPKIGTLVLATTESGNVCDDVLIYDYVCSTSKEPCFHMWDDEMWNCYTPRVIAWQPLPEPYQPKGE